MFYPSFRVYGNNKAPVENWILKGKTRSYEMWKDKNNMTGGRVGRDGDDISWLMSFIGASFYLVNI